MMDSAAAERGEENVSSPVEMVRFVEMLYRGKLAKASDEASHMMKGLNFPDAAEQDIRGAAQYLKQSSKKVAVGGFCMGGALTILAAVRVPEMDAGACFYGLPELPAAELKKIKIPLICHFANQDAWITPAKVNDFEAALKQSKSKFEIYRYDAQHAFMNETRPWVTGLPWNVTLPDTSPTAGPLRPEQPAKTREAARTSIAPAAADGRGNESRDK